MECEVAIDAAYYGDATVSAGGASGCICGHVAFPPVALGAGVKSDCYDYCVGLTKRIVALVHLRLQAALVGDYCAMALATPCAR